MITAGLFAALWLAMWGSLEYGYRITLLLALPAAGFLVRLFVIQHDCGHGSLFRSRRVNDWVGRLLGRRRFLALAAPDVLVDPALGTQSDAVLTTQGHDRESQRNDFAEEGRQLQLRAPIPAGLELLAQADPVSRQRPGGLRLEQAVAPRLQHQSERLAELVTIARKAPPAFELQRPLGPPLEQQALRHPVRHAFESKRGQRLRRQNSWTVTS